MLNYWRNVYVNGGMSDSFMAIFTFRDGAIYSYVALKVGGWKLGAPLPPLTQSKTANNYRNIDHKFRKDKWLQAVFMPT